MTFRPTLRCLLALVASLASATEARVACERARPFAPAEIARPWREALEALSEATAAPGHPWSCSGGTVALEPAVEGMRLRVGPTGGPFVVRDVATPEDVVPLGQALLAMPLAAPSPPPSAPVSAADAPAEPDVTVDAPPPPSPALPGARPLAVRTERVLLAAGVDGRFAGRSNMAWVGPVASVSFPVGRWLPSLAFRQQSAVGVRSGALDELAAALTVQARFPLRSLEVRAGGVLRGAAVTRDLGRRQGEQSELEGRVGALASLVIPVVRWGSLALSVDGDVVAISRKTADLTTTATLAPFPTFTIGGGLAFQVAP